MEPLTTTSFRLCGYDRPGGVPRLFLNLFVPAGGLCRGKPCWTVKRNLRGFVYSDPDLVHDGVRRLDFDDGVRLFEGKIKAQAKGPALQGPSLPLDPTVTMHVVNSRGDCWVAHFGTAQANTASRFIARDDGSPAP